MIRIHKNSFNSIFFNYRKISKFLLHFISSIYGYDPFHAKIENFNFKVGFKDSC